MPDTQEVHISTKEQCTQVMQRFTSSRCEVTIDEGVIHIVDVNLGSDIEIRSLSAAQMIVSLCVASYEHGESRARQRLNNAISNFT